MIEDKIYDRVRLYVKEQNMLKAGDGVIAGISGGGDSTVMLLLLARLREELGFSLLAVHVNHGIRGAEAQRDQCFVQELCERLAVPCSVFAFPVPELAKEWKMGLEEAGRRLRQRAFAEAAGPWKAEGKRIRVALAHNRNDLAETMLHHLARGSGLRGLAGIRPVSGNRIRPVLCLERKEIDHYLEERGISPMEDSSNREDGYTRNRIRHHILPLLEEEVNRQAAAHMAEAARVLALADDYFSERAEGLLERCRMPDESYLLGTDFQREALLVKEYTVLLAVERLAGQRRDVTSVHVKEVLKLEALCVGSSVSLPYGITAEKGYGGVRIRRNLGNRAENFREKEWPLCVPGELDCPLGRFHAEIFTYTGQKFPQKKCTKWLDYDKIEYHLSVRTRREGDFLVINAQGQKKKVNRCMIDEKIPREHRDAIALVAQGSEILWIAGGRMSEKYKITPGTKRVLEIRYQGGKQNE